MEQLEKPKTRLLLAEGQTLFRAGLRMLLSIEPEIEVVGEAGDGIEAVRLALELSPDLLLTDLSMPKMNGVEAIRQIKAARSNTRVLVLTGHRGSEHVGHSLKAGADGYLLKDARIDELTVAIDCVARGDGYFSAEIFPKIGAAFAGRGSGLLTGRECEVLRLIASGCANKQIAGQLFISVKTVEKHRANLMKKLDLHNASTLTAYAIEKGYFC